MGFLKKIFRGMFGDTATIQQLPTGSLTVDRHGSVVTSTVSSAFPSKILHEIGHDVLELFREARAAHMPLAEVNLYFGSLRITARELRGGAVIFLFPQIALMPTPNAQRL